MQLILGHALCYSLTYKDSKQDLDGDSRGKQRTKITHKKTLNTFDHVRSLLLQYCKDLWELQFWAKRDYGSRPSYVFFWMTEFLS